MDYSLRDILQGQGSVCRLALLSERCNATGNDLIVDFKASSAAATILEENQQTDHCPSRYVYSVIKLVWITIRSHYL